MTQRLAKWAAEEAHLATDIAQLNWITFPRDLAQKTATPDQHQALVDGVTSLCRCKSKSEIGTAARKFGLLAAPVMDMKDIAESPQYRERGLFTPVRITPDGGKIDPPRAFRQFSIFKTEPPRPQPPSP